MKLKSVSKFSAQTVSVSTSLILVRELSFMVSNIYHISIHSTELIPSHLNLKSQSLFLWK